LAATGPNVDILSEFLSEGASVHLRSRTGRTPLFLAARAGLKPHVALLREAGAHLHTDELATAKVFALSADNAEVWKLAGMEIG
jgi:lysophospholipase